jgi:hypothetical protein
MIGRVFKMQEANWHVSNANQHLIIKNLYFSNAESNDIYVMQTA